MAVLDDAIVSGDGRESTNTKAAALITNRQRTDKHKYERALYLSPSLSISLFVSLSFCISLSIFCWWSDPKPGPTQDLSKLTLIREQHVRGESALSPSDPPQEDCTWVVSWQASALEASRHP